MKRKMKRKDEHKCDCCGQGIVGMFDDCPVCGWTDDYAQRNYPDVANMPNNKMSLNQARKAWKEGRKIE
jgi:anaerobic ribonucleoside-triphosphate reductase